MSKVTDILLSNVLNRRTIKVLKELMEAKPPTYEAYLKAAKIVSQSPEKTAEVLGALGTSGDLTMIRKMVIWEAESGPIIR